MSVTAKVIAHSRADGVPDLITLQVRFPWWLLPEMNAHRVFSRNYGSTRAIPIGKLIGEADNDPALPVKWTSHRPGMQGGDDLSETQIKCAEDAYLEARDHAVKGAEKLLNLGIAKQNANRLLMPFIHVNGIVTATEWDNFFELRCHPDADPTMRALAEAMRAAMDASKPKKLTNGEWHLPYVEETDLPYLTRAKISAARCARVSYLTHDGQKPSVEQDLALYERLAGSRPLHASPLEHQASPDLWDQPELHGNLRGWKQFRKLVEMGRVS